MTHKPPQGIDAPNCAHKELKKQMVGEFVYYVCECGQKGLVEPWDGKVSVLAPPDPRKDLAIPPFGWQLRAVEEALGKLRDAPLAKFLERGYHFNSQDDKNEAMGLGRDLANGIFDAIAQRLAEMRGAKR